MKAKTDSEQAKVEYTCGCVILIVIMLVMAAIVGCGIKAIL